MRSLSLTGAASPPGFALPPGVRCRNPASRKPMPADPSQPVDNAFSGVLLPELAAALGPLDEGSADRGLYSHLVFVGPDAPSQGLTLWSVAGRTDGDKPIAPTEPQWSDGSYAWFPLVGQGAGSYGSVGGTADSVVARGHGLWTLFFGGTPVFVPLQSSTLVLTSTSPASPLALELQGVLGVEVFLRRLRDSMKLSATPCVVPPALEQAVRLAADTMESGAFDAERDCDAISFGVSARLYPAKLGAETENFTALRCP